MGVPKRRTSTQRKGKRRAKFHLAMPALIPCPNCGQPKLLHHVCPSCGGYKSKKNEKSPRPKT